MNPISRAVKQLERNRLEKQIEFHENILASMKERLEELNRELGI